MRLASVTTFLLIFAVLLTLSTAADVVVADGFKIRAPYTYMFLTTLLSGMASSVLFEVFELRLLDN